MGTRTVSAALGMWLFTSAFLWPHEPVQFHNAWVVGVLAVVAAVAGLQGVRGARLLDAALGGWLLVTALIWSSHSATFWNHTFVGLALATFGMAPTFKNLNRREPLHI
ncbi:MAG TPA: hypothetical protein VGG33_14225 [Polyangia bacterium]